MFSFVFERQLSYFFPTAAYRNLHCVISHKLKLFQNTKMYVFNLNVLYIIFWSGLHASSLTFGLFSHTVPQLRASRKLHETASIPVFFFLGGDGNHIVGAQDLDPVAIGVLNEGQSFHFTWKIKKKRIKTQQQDTFLYFSGILFGGLRFLKSKICTQAQWRSGETRFSSQNSNISPSSGFLTKVTPCSSNSSQAWLTSGTAMPMCPVESNVNTNQRVLLFL